MIHSTIILALAGLTVANKVGFSARKGAQANLLPAGADSGAITLAVTCSSFETDCDGYCIDSLGECCSNGDGSYCELGDYCVNGGCCEIGETCSGDPEGCSDDQQSCGDYCIPQDAVCCDSTGSYCDPGETCDGSGFCLTGDDDDDDDDDSSSSSTSSDDDDDDSSTLCTRRGRGGGGGGGGGDDEGDGCGGDGEDAGSLNSPSLLLGLLVILPLIL